MKVICVGRNYSEHAKELNNEIPVEPVIFLKPESALLKAEEPFFLPTFSNEIHYEGELIFRVSMDGKLINKQNALNYIDAVSIGIDLTARDLQTKCKEKGLPWERAKAFDGSAIIGDFIPLENNNIYDFELLKNGKIVQKSNSNEMLFNISKIIENVSTFITINKGDIIFTGTPAGVGPIKESDIYEGFVNSKKLLYCEIKKQINH